MYESHFALKSRPFGSKAEGGAVFVGPQQAKIMTNLHKGLVARDAVVTVTGPVGVGKTTIVNRALQSISPGRMAAWVGRMHLAHDEVLDLLLAGFAIRQQAKGTIRRFAAFRRLLAERATAGVPVAIVVEDAHRIGADALVELESLTAADTADATGANIILMGRPDLLKLLATPELARMQQRNRLRQKIEPFSAAEVTGYLKHCIREAGGEYEKIFGNGVAGIVFGCSGGIPRIVNTICESALTTAMEENRSCVSAALMYQVAVDAFGYEGPAPQAQSAEDTEVGWEAPPAAEINGEPDEEDLPTAARNIVVESGCYPELPQIPETSPVVAQAAAHKEEDVDDKIPQLIDDTQPELSTLPMQPSAEATVADAETTADSTAIQERPPGLEAFDPVGSREEKLDEAGNTSAQKETPGAKDDDGNDNFDLDAALSIETDATNVMQGITPQLDSVARDKQAKAGDPPAVAAPAAADLPTLSDSMRVDVDKEVKKVQQHDAAPAKQAEPERELAAKPAIKTQRGPIVMVSELTARMEAIGPGNAKDDIDALQSALEAAKNGDLGELLAAPAEPPLNGVAAIPTAEEEPPPVAESMLDNELPEQPELNEELLKCAEDISNANSLEEFSDAMAETLFGNETFNQIAADVVANPPPENQSAEAVTEEELADAPPAGPSPVKLADSAILKMTGDEPPATTPIPAGPPIPPRQDAGLTDSQAVRANMLAALKQGAKNLSTEQIELGKDSGADTPGTPRAPQPESIEDQINTSITQTLEALDLARVADKMADEPDTGDDETEKKSGGLFSRFRKSS